MNKPLDRSDAVNLARNALSDEHLMGRVSREGIRTLCEAVMELDEGLTRAVQLYKDELTKQEELEARCCPEDYGVEEWICVLTRRVGERDVQIANLTAAINAMNVTRPEAVAPKGWKLVPWNPTKRMLEVGDSLCASVGGGPLQRIHYPPGVGPEDVWECMVAAAPDVTFQGSTTPQIQPEGKANG